jgi:hypothetical protein
MIFDEIKIDSKIINEELYVNVDQLWKHLLGSSEQFSKESAEFDLKFGMSVEEKCFTMGMIQGIMTVVSILGLAQEESDFNQVNTVEDLLQRFKDNDAN